MRKQISRAARELIAPLAWIYVPVKLLVFDVDVLIFRSVAPQYLWLLDYKFFLLLGLVLLLLVVLGRKEFLTLLAFVAAYPLLVIFWKLPKRFYKQWPLAVVFLPAIAIAVTRLWSTVLLYSVTFLGALLILKSRTSWVLMLGIALLVPLLTIHLGRALRKAYATSLLTRLSDWADTLRRAIEAGTFVPWEVKTLTASPVQSTSNTATTNPRQLAYSLHWLAGGIASQVRSVAKRRHYDLYLLASWFYTVVLISVLFAFAHLGLERAFPGAYRDADGAGFWGFLGFSLGILTTSNVSRISPVASVANVASYAEVVCSIVILVILVFSILTAAREAFRENLDEFSTALVGVASALESRIRAEWQLTAIELEVALLSESPALVNALRKIKGLPELVPPDRGTKPTNNHDEAGTQQA